LQISQKYELIRKALILQDWGRLEEAMALLKKAEEPPPTAKDGKSPHLLIQLNKALDSQSEIRLCLRSLVCCELEPFNRDHLAGRPEHTESYAVSAPSKSSNV
jgi:hypothetical protein